ncbi:MAG: M6 family metalloprotease domain-containing protein [Planctomycetota bacterium]|jgi:M6 family metalloprotease-like protein|nr:M6 family metalloprotease domain-containing protein [Planctomycetota bacterium]
MTAPRCTPVLLAALALLLPAWTTPPLDDRFVSEIPPGIVAVETLRTAEKRMRGKARAIPDLGIRWGEAAKSGLTAQRVNGPAGKAKLLPGDVVRAIGKVRIRNIEDVERAMSLVRVGKDVKLAVLRSAVRKDAVIEYRAGDTVGKPGFEFKKTRGVFQVTRVTRGGPAWRGGLRVGDTFTRFDRTRLSSSGAAKRILKRRKKLSVHIVRKASRFTARVEPAPAPKETVRDWKGKTFKLAVICIDFKDVKHNPAFTTTDLERMLFSKNEYRRAPDGRVTCGSMRDYYEEQSVGTFEVEGKVFDWVTVPETWSYYDEQDMGAGDGSRRTVFRDALAGLYEKFGKKALAGHRGIVFLYAGERKSLRGSQLWPHRSTITAGGLPKPYYIVEEGGKEFASIGVHCHEFGHMLGLPDFYGYGHRTGIGKFCTMAIGHLGAGESKKDRPFHLCAYCKMSLGWLEPKIVHPGDTQHIALRPIQGSMTEAIKVLVSPSGDEYFLLEARGKRGFDADFFREGMLIWHVGEDGQRARGQIAVAIDLEEAHGKRYFDASLREESECIFPSRHTDAFTPNTFPASTSNLASAYEVAISDVRVFRPKDGKPRDSMPPGTVFFRIDTRRSAQVRASEPEQPVYPKDEPVSEIDPVTELPVPFEVGDDNVAKPGPNIIPRDRYKKKDGKKKKKKADKGDG